MTKELPFPKFRRALRESETATTAIPPATFYRYARGELPATLEWLLRDAALLRALADDADVMDEMDWRAWRRAVGKRSKAAKDRRDKERGDE
jgi:hypothetical protein